MDYNYTLLIASFLKRPNRFLAHVLLDGEEVVAHVPNTGRLGELLVPGAKVAISHHPEAHRKTKYSLRMAMKNETWFSLDSQIPNDLVEEALKKQTIPFDGSIKEIKREQKFGQSRFDLKVTDTEGQVTYIEVKGVTLESQGLSMFPDAPTTRGTKHVRELKEAVEAGHKGRVIFVLQFEGAQCFRPHWERDTNFCQALVDASKAGVSIEAYSCQVGLESTVITTGVPVSLEPQNIEKKQKE